MYSLLPSKNSMQKKALLTSLAVALLAVLQEKLKAVTLVILPVHNAKCSQLFALPAEKKLLFLSNRQATSRYIAAIATHHANVITGKI